MRALIAALIGLTLSGTASGQGTDSGSPEPDLCGAAGFQGLIGQTGEIARLLVLDQPLRVLPPGAPISRDLRRERLNIILDEHDVITGIHCG